MSTKPLTPRPAAMLGRFGSHLVLSLGIALALAGAASLPQVLGGKSESAAIQPLAKAAPETVVTISGGKIIDRLSLAAGEDRPETRPFTPAALAMPMAVAWAEQPVARPVPAAPPAKLRSAATEMVPLPPRRDADLADGRPAGAAPPLPILPAAQATGPDGRAEEGGWRRILTMPATKVADAVSGTAEAAQAVGSWTLSRAAGLLPRW